MDGIRYKVVIEKHHNDFDILAVYPLTGEINLGFCLYSEGCEGKCPHILDKHTMTARQYFFVKQELILENNLRDSLSNSFDR